MTGKDSLSILQRELRKFAGLWLNVGGNLMVDIETQKKKKISLFFQQFPDKGQSTMAETQVQDCLVENKCIQLLGGLCQD